MSSYRTAALTTLSYCESIACSNASWHAFSPHRSVKVVATLPGRSLTNSAYACGGRFSKAHAWRHRWSSGSVCFPEWGCVAAAFFAAPFSGGSPLLVAVGSAVWGFTVGAASKNEQALLKLMASAMAAIKMIVPEKFTVSPLRNWSWWPAFVPAVEQRKGRLDRAAHRGSFLPCRRWCWWLEQNLRCGHGATHHPWGPLGHWQTSREMPQILALGARRAP